MGLLEAFMNMAHVNLERTLAVGRQPVPHRRQRSASGTGAAVNEPDIAPPCIPWLPAAPRAGGHPRIAAAGSRRRGPPIAFNGTAWIVITRAGAVPG
jgi:hypothetical protein